MARIQVIASYTPSLINFRGPLIKRLISLGHEVVACSPGDDQNTLNTLQSLGVTHYSYPLQRTGSSPIADLRTYKSLQGIMDHVRPTHLLAYTIKPVIYGCLAAKSCNIENIHAIITGLGTSFQASSPAGTARRFIVQRLYKQALRGCSSVIFQNPDDRTLFIDHGLVNHSSAKLTNGSGIDLNHYRHRVGSFTKPVFLLMARLIHEKGILIYAEAARTVKETFPNAEFRLAGFFENHPDAIHHDEVEQWVKTGIITYVGKLEDVRNELINCSVYCLPSYYREGVPRSILEALATGRPIITTDSPGCRETVTPGVNGWIVPPRDSRALADAMIDACQKHTQLEIMGNSSRELAESRFDVEKVNDDIVSIMNLA